MMPAIVMLCSCSKKSNVTPATGINLLSGNWAITQWGSVSNNTLIFKIDKTTDKGTVDAISGNGFGLHPARLFSAIKHAIRILFNLRFMIAFNVFLVINRNGLLNVLA